MSNTPTVPLRRLANEARRIRRERIQRRIEAGAAIAMVVVWYAYLIIRIVIFLRMG